MIGLASDSISGFGDAQRVSAILDSPPLSGDVLFVTSWAEFNDLNPAANSVDIRSFAGSVTDVVGDIIPPPAAGRQRQVKYISVINLDPDDMTVTITVDYTSSTTATTVRITLPFRFQLYYSDTRGWYVLDRNGGLVTTDIAGPTQQFTKIILSQSASGRPIAVAATATPGTLIHTTAATGLDEIWLWVNNRTGAAATLTIEFGGVTAADQIVNGLSIPANSSSILVVQGLIMSAGDVVRAFSGTASALNLVGFVNRIN